MSGRTAPFTPWSLLVRRGASPITKAPILQCNFIAASPLKMATVLPIAHPRMATPKKTG